ncbi:hypothetical protein JXM83_05260 [Candidatus Woesearchaeota archaeon]|nr:hypothetical protein [Candidatus Woesearchaeota archaeon]
MTKQLEDFFNSKGIKKYVPEFNPVQEKQIQSVIENIVKPVLTNLADELSSYANIKADIMTSKKSIDSIKENIELKVYRTMQVKFIYRLKFSIEGNDIFLIGQFCKPNFYGEAIEYKDTDLKKIITNINEDDIKGDFSIAFTTNVELK